ncbi:parathyroid hormone 1a [Centroberyx gerrardi]
MVIIRSLDCKIVFISFCILHITAHCEAGPLRRRSVSEVQLMHNLGEHKQVQERQDWLQMRLRDIHTASARGAGDPGRAKRRLLPGDLPELSDLTPEEIQYALNFLEKLLHSKH